MGNLFHLYPVLCQRKEVFPSAGYNRSMNNRMYDDLSEDYDRFVNWEQRLKVELPFLLRHLPHGRVLDAACATGWHAIALAQQGFQTAGADLSPQMIAVARRNAQAAGVALPFEVAGFGDLARSFATSLPFDGLICLGNSLPHLLTPQDLARALADFAACLRPGGTLILQNRNFDAVLARGERWMEPQAFRKGRKTWLYLRFYDFLPEGLIRFNMVRLTRERTGWTQRVTSTVLRPLRMAEVVEALREAGFEALETYGSMEAGGAPFDAQTSGNSIVVARKA